MFTGLKCIDEFEFKMCHLFQVGPIAAVELTQRF